MAGTRAAQKDLTRRKILDHAREMVVQGGVEALTIAPLMASLNLTHGGFYAHFSSREHLLNEVVAELCSRVLLGFEMTIDQADPKQSLRRYVDLYLSEKHRDTTQWGCPLSYLSRDVPKLSAPAKARYAEAHTQLTRAFADLLRRAGAPDAAPLSQSLVAELVGALSLARALENTRQSGSVLAASRRSLKARIHEAVARPHS